MKKELVKVGMKVKISDSAFALMESKVSVNVFIVDEYYDECIFILKPLGSNNNLKAHCADFEPCTSQDLGLDVYFNPNRKLLMGKPYEEPKEDIFDGNSTNVFKMDDIMFHATTTKGLEEYIKDNSEPKVNVGDSVKYKNMWWRVLTVSEKGVQLCHFSGMADNVYVQPLELQEVYDGLNLKQKEIIYCEESIKNKEPKKESTTYQVKDLEGNVIEEKVVWDKPNDCLHKQIEVGSDGIGRRRWDMDAMNEMQKEYRESINNSLKCSEPITQEFIESFGFELAKSKSPAKKFVKTMKDKQAQLYWADSGEFSMHIDEMLEDRNAIFIGYTCTTQSELRFLLTKGRIDCSK